MPVPAEIKKLVERFTLHREDYQAGNYNETQLRREFIDPMFKALGWDIDNESGNAEAYKDVIHEEALRFGGSTTAPDYGFRIGGTRKFFLEAKRPAENIEENREHAYQLRRYGWSAKLPLSILTNFAEFAVYDCRIKPEVNDKASKARVKFIRFEEYLDRWDEIASIFSREAVLKGSFDRYADSTKSKRGTGEVDTEFLKEIENWRLSLARNLALRNPDLDQRGLNFAVQRIIDRLVFLRIAEDRGIEDYGQLQALLNGAKVYARMAERFRAADDRYNSGLFHFTPEKGRQEPPDEFTLALKIDDDTLKEIVRKLYYPDSPYEFSVLPADILGQVYEQFLGKVIRLTTGHQAKVEEKPEVKKAGGVYYTPTFIVDYIVKQTVGRLLEGKTPKQAAKLKVLDPACGSGSFLIGAYQFLLDWHRDWYANHNPEKSPKEVYAAKDGWRLTTAKRKEILLNNIFGVDIDSQAVEVTKLSLLLKVLEGENRETLERQKKLFHQRALPDLGSNIKCGNSLIGPDFYNGQQLSLFDADEQYRINAFDWQTEFQPIMKSGGFDAVIGNPPYGGELSTHMQQYLLAHYRHQTYQLDSYLLFLEQSVSRLLAEQALYGVIIPNPWLTNLLQTKMRKFVMGQTSVLEVVHFKFPVFPKVTVDTEILVLKKTPPINNQVVVSVAISREAFGDEGNKSGLTFLQHDQEKWHALDGGVVNIFLTKEDESLAAKCRKAGSELGNLCAINVGIKPYQTGKGTPQQTAAVVQNRPFDSDRRLDKSYRQYLRGADIGRFRIAPIERRFLKYGPWLAEPRPAANFEAGEKILMRQTGDSLVAAIDRKQFLCLNNMHVIVAKDSSLSMPYVLGILNSSLLNWYYHTLNPEVGEALAEVKRANVARLPIRVIDFKNKSDKSRHDRVVELVVRMLALHEAKPKAKTDQDKTVLERQIATVDRQLDQLVYELYGLTDTEIALVEEATTR